jgi:hypothetical protein
MALLIKADGTFEEVAPVSTAKRPKFKLEELQGHIGGYVEIIYLRDGRMMLVDEDGRIKKLALNRRATLLASMEIVGDVLVCFRREF